MENKVKHDSDSNDAINNSSLSIKEDFLKNNREFYEKGLEQSMQTLNSNFYSTINSTFANFNNDFEKRLERNRENHEKAITSLTNESKKSKDLYSKKKENLEKREESLEFLSYRFYKLKNISKIFKFLKAFYVEKKFKNKKNKIIADKILLHKRKRKIFNILRNITSAVSKGRIKLKYRKLFDEKNSELQANYMLEIKRLTEVLNNLEIDIKKEIEQRRSLAALYDNNMNKGVEAFIKETNQIADFNSSSKDYFNF